MDVVKIKCGNSFSENGVKGHQPVLNILHTKDKESKLAVFSRFFR
jgi:hypothetical protein